MFRVSIFIALLPLSYGYFNLSYTTKDWRKWKNGSLGEIDVIENGTVNNRKRNSIVILKSNDTELDFNLQSKYNIQVQYNFTAKNNSALRYHPIYSIRENNTLLTNDSFTVTFECTGTFAGKIKMLLNLSIYINGSNDYNLPIKINKMCDKIPKRPNDTRIFVTNVTTVTQATMTETTVQASKITSNNKKNRRLIFACIGAFCGILIVIFITVLSLKRTKKWRENENKTLLSEYPVFHTLTMDRKFETFHNTHQHSLNSVTPYAVSTISTCTTFQNSSFKPGYLLESTNFL